MTTDNDRAERLTRWNVGHGWMREEPDGEFVEYSEAAKALAAKDARIAELEEVVGKLPADAECNPVILGERYKTHCRGQIVAMTALSYELGADNEMWVGVAENPPSGKVYRLPNQLRPEAARAAAGKGGDCTKCPHCGGPADNGYSRDVPPKPYYCSKCEGCSAAAEEQQGEEER